MFQLKLTPPIVHNSLRLIYHQTKTVFIIYFFFIFGYVYIAHSYSYPYVCMLSFIIDLNGIFPRFLFL